jgi:hypothetical protein
MAGGNIKVVVRVRPFNGRGTSGFLTVKHFMKFGQIR